jgi:hypothetical protein
MAVSDGGSARKPGAGLITESDVEPGQPPAGSPTLSASRPESSPTPRRAERPIARAPDSPSAALSASLAIWACRPGRPARRLVPLGLAVACEDAVGEHVQALVVPSMCSIRPATSPGWAWSARLAFPPARRPLASARRSVPEDPQRRLRGSAAYPSTPARASSLQPARRCSLQAATRASSMAPSSPARSATTIMCLVKRAGTLKVAGNVRTISSR